MTDRDSNAEPGCNRCRDMDALGFEISMAFQPIVNMDDRSVFAYEALVRGPAGESAATVFAQVNADNLYRFDQACRIKAIELASKLGLETNLSINFMPNAVYRPESCIQATLVAASKYDFPIERIIFEINEADRVDDRAHLRGIVEYYKQRGFCTAIDDFGAGYAGLNLLAEFVPDLVKLDMDLVRNIDTNRTRQAIVRHMTALSEELGIRVIAEGIETRAELDTLADLGVHLIQGYLLARPGFETLAKPAFDWD